MKSRREQLGISPIQVGVIVLLLAAPLLYVLGLGPAIWVHHATPSPTIRGAIEAIYWPLETLCDQVEPLEIVIQRYAELWD